jgi:hypothetical protein
MEFSFANPEQPVKSPLAAQSPNLQRAARPTRQPQGRDLGRSDQISPSSYRTKDDFEHAKDAAFKRFDEDWDSRKKSLERAKDYYDYQADHANGAAKEQWKAKKEETKQRMNQLDDQKDAAKDVLKKKWND